MDRIYDLGFGASLSSIEIPAVQYGPISFRIGSVQCLLRASRTEEVIEKTEINLSPRVTAPVLVLASGEKIIVSHRRLTSRPAGIDGVLRTEPGKAPRWSSHRLIDELQSKAAAVGWPAVVSDIANAWNDQFSFRAERPEIGGQIEPGSEGLRPPQIGALHAIGMHWSLYHQAATIVMPTGTGKTETMLAALAAYIREPLLVVVPSDVLRSQTARKFLSFGLLRQLKVLSPNVPNPIVGIVTKRPRTSDDLEIFDCCNVVISTMSSLGVGDAAESLAAGISQRVKTLMVDEAHHIAANGWAAFREVFSKERVLQFTATPFRRDGRLVDGLVIYNYPLRTAQNDGYFKKISFEPVYEINPSQADEAVAGTALARLRTDLDAGLNHLMMARCGSISRATDIQAIYARLAPDLNPLLVHSEMGDTRQQIDTLRSGQSRIVVCVNMLGEGFDLPELKIAAIHDLHKSLAILLQFTGRFTRSAARNIGDATVVANIADPNVSGALERLYSEDADWNLLLSEMSSKAAQEHAELIAFLGSSQRLDRDDQPDNTPISQQILRPTLGTLFYKATSFSPKRFHDGLPKDLTVYRVWLHAPSNTLYFVTYKEPSVTWARSRAVKDREWALFILHYDQDRELLYLSSSDHSSLFEGLAHAVGGTDMISGDIIFRSLGRINRLIFQNVGVKKHGRRNLRYAMYTGADVANALSLSEQSGSIKSNLSGTGWEAGRPTTIGCSYKGRIWSRENGPIPRFVEWCESVGDKLVDDTIDTSKIIANVLIPEEVSQLPAERVLGIEWPVEIIAQAEERISLLRDQDERTIALFELLYLKSNVATNTLTFQLIEAETGAWGDFEMTIGGDRGFVVKQSAGSAVSLKIGPRLSSLDVYLSDFPPLVRFIDLTELDGNLLIRPQNPQDIRISEDSFESWDWRNVDIGVESIWKGSVKRDNSIQERAANHFIDAGFDIVFDDDDAGEAADLVCFKEEDNYLRLALVHCKFSGGTTPGERVADVVEVCSQAVRSSKWKWRFRELCRHLLVREAKLTGRSRPTRFMVGGAADLNKLVKIHRFKEVRAEIVIVQPGLSQGSRTPDQSAVLAAAMTYLKQTIAVDLDIICSA